MFTQVLCHVDSDLIILVLNLSEKLRATYPTGFKHTLKSFPCKILEILKLSKVEFSIPVTLYTWMIEDIPYTHEFYLIIYLTK